MNLVAATWYQVLNVQPWASDLIAMNRRTVEIYLRHFYSHWWGDGAIEEARFQEVVDRYSEPGAFDASLGWYRSRRSTRATEAQDALAAATIDLPTEVLWGERDPVTPVAFAESLGESFSRFNLVRLPSVGHFAPREAPEEVVAALDRLLARLPH